MSHPGRRAQHKRGALMSVCLALFTLLYPGASLGNGLDSVSASQ
jgi:hypothetical protein